MWTPLRALWLEPAPERPSKPAWWDRALVLVLVPLTLFEGFLREVLVQRPGLVLISSVCVGAVWFRRTHPLPATAVAFGLAAVATAVAWLGGLPHVDLSTSAVILLLPYSLFRWGAGRETLLGLAFMSAAYGAGVLNGELRRAGDAIGAAVVLLFPAALGASVRFRAHALDRAVEHARLREREQLARELHDTVAHHVTAITIQAQAGRAVIALRPDAAAQSLAAIEDEARSTLAELRDIVGVLRQGETADLAPQPRIADLEHLARSGHETLRIEVALVGDLDGLRPSVETAVYRLAQESITNALRHARGARTVRVRVAADAGIVRLTVHDDGEAQALRRGAGFGLVGMAERAALLGGTFEAGPGANGGWSVHATLPRNGGGR